MSGLQTHISKVFERLRPRLVLQFCRTTILGQFESYPKKKIRCGLIKKSKLLRWSLVNEDEFILLEKQQLCRYLFSTIRKLLKPYCIIETLLHTIYFIFNQFKGVGKGRNHNENDLFVFSINKYIWSYWTKECNWTWSSRAF